MRAARIVARVLLGCLFVWAGWWKLQDTIGFARQVTAYRLVPWEWINVVALFLPWLELVSGWCLAAGIWTRASALLVGAQLIVYSAAIAVALAKGLTIACGCYGVDLPISGWNLALNVFLLALALWLVWNPPRARGSGQDQAPSGA